MPLLFDAREHLPLPDLSAYPRLRFLTTTDFPPFSFADQNARLAGFHIDLVREICAVLALQARCQIQAVPFDELETDLSADQAEAAVAAVAVTPERRERFGFSRPYMLLPARFAAVKSAVKPGGTVPEPGWKVGLVKATVHEAMAKAWFPTMQSQSFDSQGDMLEALRQGTIDAVFSDALRLSFWVSGGASQECCVLAPGAFLSERFLGEGLAIMVKRQDRVLAAAFDHALAELVVTGRLDDIYLRYFPLGLF
ncbi:transporter substrate-binding domain-containing protein [Rhizobiaceae bacterium BDR2-2]|uniref:Transporter substrate-binding domain-containing protein n=2 Tax=Ectorhizobium quercum TaxID=2965071 RepID=A0AAE3MW55_9HYPH|nr:transporter substrate-binding domain-containing protein [Ectorhizobium quercum]MCX8995989.1 transporter substrate-binding domain-containing protein [Ectorhizobium quercum]